MNMNESAQSGRLFLFRRPYLLGSIALHAALVGCLYYFGSYQLELRRADERVAASVQATHHARSARRVDDLKKIKELLEKSAQRADEAQPAASAAAPPSRPASTPAPTPPDSDPKEMLKEARELAKSIEEIDRDLKAEELARLTGKAKEEARAEVDARAPQAVTPSDDPTKEIAKLEAAARQVLAQRAETLQRQQDGVAVSASAAEHAGSAGAGTADADSAGTGQGNGESGAGQSVSGNAKANGGAAPLVQQIAEFMRDGVEAERGPNTQHYRGQETAFFHDGVGQIPHVSPHGMIKAQGRMLGAGGQFANRVYLNSWYLIGPFQGRHGGGLFNNPKYPPEDAVLLDAVYRGKDGRLVKWEYVNAPTYPLIPRDHAEDAVYYGYTEVVMDQERDLMVWIGADDDAQVYLNDKMIWKGGNWNKQWFWQTLYDTRNTYVSDFNRTEGRRIVRFKKGSNKVFFKLSNGPTRMFFSMVLTLPEQR